MPQDYIYDDQGCFANGVVDHSVLVLGYDLSFDIPFWIIQNSWGPDWGNGGYMFLSITGGDGTCGIQSTPALFPVVQGRGSLQDSAQPLSPLACTLYCICR